MQRSICVTWIPPFTLNLTHIDPDLQYLVQVVNVSDSVAIPCIECPLNETEYEFTVANPDPCDTFEFSVAAKNKAGIGNTSAPVIGHFHESNLLHSYIIINTIAIVHEYTHKL